MTGDMNFNWDLLDGAAMSSNGAAAQEETPAVVSLHPDLRLLLDENLSGTAGDAKNLCIVVGVIRRERYRDGKAIRPNRTPLGVLEAPIRLEINEISHGNGDLAVQRYSLRLQISAGLWETGLFAEGARLAIAGPIRLEQTYDRRFARNEDDAGMPVWEPRIDVVTVQTAGTEISDGSWVKLEGEVERDPIIREEMIGPGMRRRFASVWIRHRGAARGLFPHSRAVHPVNTLLPVMAFLDDEIPGIGGLLRRGNVVRLEGRLMPYTYRRSQRDGRVAEAIKREEARIQRTTLDENARRREIYRAHQRLLIATQMSIEAGYVDLLRGRALDAEELATLEAMRPSRRRARSPERAPRQRHEPSPEEVADAMDAAIIALIQQGSEAASANRSENELGMPGEASDETDEAAPQTAEARPPETMARARPRRVASKLAPAPTTEE